MVPTVVPSVAHTHGRSQLGVCAYLVASQTEDEDLSQAFTENGVRKGNEPQNVEQGAQNGEVKRPPFKFSFFDILRFLVRQSAVQFDCRPEARERVRPARRARVMPPWAEIGGKFQDSGAFLAQMEHCLSDHQAGALPMDDAKPDIRALFCDALDRKSPDELAEYLDAACGGDAHLRAQVEELLASHRDAGKFLGGTSASGDVTLDKPPVELPGTQIGPYKLLEQIGEGGMGVVYVASQREPIRRKVALKIIKPGMDTREVVARFEAERQALALMDHPNIAKVFDAGATDAGRPYFVMELVKGTPITEYCDREQLSTRERLELFVTRLPRRAARASERRDPPRSQAQ